MPLPKLKARLDQLLEVVIGRVIKRIYIHCSDSLWGEVEEIRSWHLQRGWSDIGYHFIICNPYPNYAALKNGLADFSYDGALEIGRPLEKRGAHVKGDNKNTIGICLVGVKDFTDAQLQTLFELLKKLTEQFKLTIYDVLGHYEYWHKQGLEALKSCPNIDMKELRNRYVEWDRTQGKQLNVT